MEKLVIIKQDLILEPVEHFTGGEFDHGFSPGYHISLPFPVPVPQADVPIWK